MRALRVALRPVVVMLALAGIGAVPVQRVTLTLADANGEPLPDPVPVYNGTRGYPGGSNTVVRVVISPAPAIAPAVTFGSDDPAAVAIGPDNTNPSGTTVPLATSLHAAGGGKRAVVTAHVGPPYDVTLRARIAAFGNTNLGCTIGTYPARAFAADGGELRASSPDDADVYLTVVGDPARSGCRAFTVPDQGPRELYHFPYGAVRLTGDAPFASLRASQWRDDVRETPDGRGVWIARAKSGATVKLAIPFGPLDVAPAGHEFAPLGPPAITSVTTTIALPRATRFTASITVRDSLVNERSEPANTPLIVGYARRNRYFDSLFDAGAGVMLSPEPFVVTAPEWSTSGPVTVAAGGRVIATGIGVGTVAARFAPPIGAHASRRVLAYGTLSLGCNDLSDGFGVAFGDEGTPRIVHAPGEADFYASSDASAFRCATDAASGGWYFPGGGVMLHGTPFAAVAPALWRNAIVTVPSDEVRRAGGGTILLFRTRSGRLVKFLAIPRATDSFFGYYAVARTDGTFAY